MQLVLTEATRRERLWRYSADDAYVVHPATRKASRDLLPVLARSDKVEDPYGSDEHEADEQRVLGA
ncbi:MAG TPA: hypothetical protein VGU20_10825 [Stellaceae bacterium]|nr:hypothetical protein [Stellaceae bacterium]